MNKFATGFLIGNIVGMTSIWLKSAKNPKKSISKTAKGAIAKMGELVDDLVDMYR